jgi:teichuronic acid biosynthesis glycosyltransferase TuaG
MNNELVSVIMPVYNGERYLKAAAQSVLSQTWQNLELLLIDDGSTDDSRSVMLELAADERVRCIYLPANKGAAGARNAGILEAKGRFIAFLDTDDTWTHDKLERQIPFMMSEKVALSFTAYDWMNEQGIPTGRTIQAPAHTNHKKLLRFNSIGCLTAIYDTAVCGKMYMPNTPQRHDWGLWLAITRQFGSASGLNQVLACYRVSKHSLSGNKLRSSRYNWMILRKYEKLSWPVAVWYYSLFIVFKFLKYINLTRL